MNPDEQKWALVTGGDSGIGKAVATELARRGYDLILVSRTPARLEAAAGELGRTFPERTVVWKSINLAVCGAAEELHDWTVAEKLDVEVLVNDAGVFIFKDVCDTPISRLDEILALHVRTVTMTCRLFGKDMAEKGRGFILNLSSYSLYMPWPGITVYGATKAYIRHFSISLSKELRENGVYVCAVAPGWIDTDLMGLSDRIRGLGRKIGILMSPEKLARRSVRALFRGRRYVVPGWYNRAFIPLVKHLDPYTTRFVRNRTKKYQK